MFRILGLVDWSNDLSQTIHAVQYCAWFVSVHVNHALFWIQVNPWIDEIGDSHRCDVNCGGLATCFGYGSVENYDRAICFDCDDDDVESDFWNRCTMATDFYCCDILIGSYRVLTIFSNDNNLDPLNHHDGDDARNICAMNATDLGRHPTAVNDVTFYPVCN